jgi:hypothetical protein
MADQHKPGEIVPTGGIPTGPPGHEWRPGAALALLVALIATVGVVVAILQRPPNPAPTRPTPIPTSIPTPTPTVSQAAPDLSGTWAGLCTGPFNGFCSLTWTQAVNALDGTFTLSSPPDNLHISGNLTGSTMRFGAAGVITFTGTLSGSTMSGSYTDIANGKMGTWTVTLAP